MELDREIIGSFQEEANEIINSLRIVVEALEDHTGEFPKSLLEEFANKADRMMGAAKTFDTMYPGHKVFDQIGKFGELCKATGYKASVLNHQALVPIFAAFWADTLDILEELCQNVGDEDKIRNHSNNYIPLLQKRLTWLAKQVVELTKGTSAEAQSTINVDGILKRMGIS